MTSIRLVVTALVVLTAGMARAQEPPKPGPEHALLGKMEGVWEAKIKMLFAIYPGLETELLEKNAGEKALEYIFTYVTSSQIAYEVNFGMTLAQFREAWNKKYTDGKVEFGTVTQAAMAFAQVQGAFSLIVTQFQELSTFAAIIDPDVFLEPGEMPARIAAHCAKTRQAAPETHGEYVRAILEGLALRYRQVVENLEALAHRGL